MLSTFLSSCHLSAVFWRFLDHVCGGELQKAKKKEGEKKSKTERKRKRTK
jgi:hypothetical protein